MIGVPEGPGLTEEDRLLKIPLHARYVSIEITKRGTDLVGCAAGLGCLGVLLVSLLQAVILRALDREHTYFTITVRETGRRVHARAHPFVVSALTKGLRDNSKE